MHPRIVLATVVAISLVAGCGGKGSSGGSPAATADPSADASAAAVAKLQDFGSSAEGLTGRLDYRENGGPAGPLQLTGSFGFDQDFTQPPSGQLQLEAADQTPVPILIRVVDTVMYFRRGTAAWTQVTGQQASSAGSASDGELSAILQGAINPGNWSGLASAPGGTLAVEPNPGGARLRGSADVEQVLRSMTGSSDNLPVQLPVRWPDPVTFDLTCNSKGQLTQATETFHGAHGSATISITVTGYRSPPVVAPTS